MKAREFIRENQNQSLPGTSADALPSTVALPQLKNQDIYLQYRMGVALAAALAHENGEIDFDPESAFNENMIVVARTPEEEEQLRLALKMMPVSKQIKMISTHRSEEARDTNIKSPVAPKPLLKRKN